jgi:putative MFS transporter
MFVVAWMYNVWSTKWTLCVLTGLTALALTVFSLIDVDVPLVHDNLIVLFSILMVGINGIIAVLLPYSAENYPVQVRGRGTGLVAASSKFGGLAAQAITVAALVPGLGVAAMALAFPVAVSAAMVARYGNETRNRRLEDFDR